MISRVAKKKHEFLDTGHLFLSVSPRPLMQRSPTHRATGSKKEFTRADNKSGRNKDLSDPPKKTSKRLMKLVLLWLSDAVDSELQTSFFGQVITNSQDLGQ